MTFSDNQKTSKIFPDNQNASMTSWQSKGFKDISWQPKSFNDIFWQSKRFKDIFWQPKSFKDILWQSKALPDNLTQKASKGQRFPSITKSPTYALGLAGSLHTIGAGRQASTYLICWLVSFRSQGFGAILLLRLRVHTRFSVTSLLLVFKIIFIKLHSISVKLTSECKYRDLQVLDATKNGWEPAGRE